MLEAKFTAKSFQDQLDRAARKIEEAIFKRLKYLGEQSVNVARGTNSYIDQTTNLRSSIGFVITKNGKIVEENFEQKSSNGREGFNAAKKLKNQFVGKYPKGYALFVFVGMHYAEILELRGYDVLTSAELYCKQKLPVILAQLKSNINSNKL